jgi:hypothetical protein
MTNLPRPDDDRADGSLLMPVSEASKVRLGFDEHSARTREAAGNEPERLGATAAFAAELERLAALAPEPWATKLRAIAAGVAQNVSARKHLPTEAAA